VHVGELLRGGAAARSERHDRESTGSDSIDEQQVDGLVQLPTVEHLLKDGIGGRT